jgi:hypothetical protein
MAMTIIEKIPAWARPVPDPLLSPTTGVYPVLEARRLIEPAQSSAAPRSGHP